MNHIMVDIETTGPDSHKAAIIQIAAVKFQLDEPIKSNHFCRNVSMDGTGRVWEEGTRKFWADHGDVLTSIERYAEPAANVLRALSNWAGDDPVFWAKPTIFDFPFVEQYYYQFNVQSPFSFRRVRDMRSFMAGAGIEEDPKHIEFTGQKHNALDNALHQVKVLQWAWEHRW